MNFKIELGKQDPLARGAGYETATGRRRTAYTLSRDFMRGAVEGAQETLKRLGLPLPKRILVAEPIAMGTAQDINDNWLSNYRNSIERILTTVFDEVDFLPEPFAVFQYYRYGVRHALVAQKRKHIALILDFGGGTFDASIIESTKTGDIGERGRLSRPLAASSEPVGGFFLDRKISESLLASVLQKGVDRGRLRQAWQDFDTYRNYDDHQMSEITPDMRHFTKNMRRVVHDVERGKRAICQSIYDWELTADLSSATAWRVAIPTNPFAERADWRDVRFDAALLREVFEREVWDRKLKRAIGDSLRRAKSGLAGKEISIVLLSGG
jgi:hypothetical protein